MIVLHLVSSNVQYSLATIGAPMGFESSWMDKESGEICDRFSIDTIEEAIVYHEQMEVKYLMNRVKSIHINRV